MIIEALMQWENRDDIDDEIFLELKQRYEMSEIRFLLEKCQSLEIPQAVIDNFIKVLERLEVKLLS